MNTVAERVASLEKQIRNIARSHAQDNLQADDIYQYIVSEILEKSSPEDSNSRILTLARWRARNFIQKERVYLSYVDAEGTVSGPEDQDETESRIESMAADVLTPEEEIIAGELQGRLKELIASLSPENQQIVSLLAVGNSQAEIGRQMGLTRGAINQRVMQLRPVFAALI